MGNTIRRICRQIVNLGPAAQSYLIGASLAFDLFPQATAKTFERSDKRAIRSDWHAVGADMWYAVGRAEQEKRHARK